MTTKSNSFPNAEYDQLKRNDSERSAAAVTKRGNKRWRRQLCFVLLSLGVVSLAICCVALGVSLARERANRQEVCDLPQCLRDAARLKANIDPSYDPCEDFYKFSCGGWIKSHPGPEKEPSWTVMNIMAGRARRNVRDILEQPVRQKAKDSPERKIKEFYHSCVYGRSHQDTMDVLMKYLSQIGGWKYPAQNIEWWENRSWRFESALRAAHFDMESHPFFFAGKSLHGDPDLGQVTGPYIQFSPNKGCIPNRDENAYTSYLTKMAELLGAKNGSKTSRDFIEGVRRIGEKICEDETPPPRLNKSVRHDIHDHGHGHDVPIGNVSAEGSTFSFMTLSEFQEQAPVVRWTRFLQYRFPEIREDTTVIVMQKQYFEKLTTLVRTANKKDLRNFLILRSIEPFLDSLPDDFERAKLQFLSQDENEKPLSRWEYCLTKRIDTVMRFALLSEMVKANKRALEEFRQVRAIVEDVREAFLSRLDKMTWIDDVTKQDVREKMVEIKAMLGAPDWVLEENKLENIYRELDVDIGSTYLENDIRAERFQASYYIPAIMTNVDLSKNTGVEDPLTPQAYQAPGKIIITNGILQDPIYDYDSIPYLNYGSIGSIIGHELAHAFDGDSGPHFVRWSSNTSLENFRVSIECLKDYYRYAQYDGMKFGPKHPIEQLPLGQVTADAAGVKWAFEAYKDWSSRDSRSQLGLPSLKYTPDQIFFINLVQGECQSKFSEEETFPLGFRMTGLVAQSRYFKDAFKCPPSSSLASTPVCEFW